MQDSEQLKDVLAKVPAVALAVLSGSRARGCGPRSDFDVALILEPDTTAQRRRVEAAAVTDTAAFATCP